MVGEREILNIQQFYSDESELSLLEMAMYFQKMLIFSFQLEDTALMVNDSEDGTCYAVSAKLNVSDVHLVVYEDCMCAQFSCAVDPLDQEGEELLARKISMLANRSSYLKELQAAIDEDVFNCYTWISVGREYANNRTIDSILKEFIWMSTEVDRYLLERSNRNADGRA